MHQRKKGEKYEIYFKERFYKQQRDSIIYKENRNKTSVKSIFINYPVLNKMKLIHIFKQLKL